jgi:hypothetical protein
MANFQLLSGEQEVEIAKRIEAGENEVEEEVLGSPITLDFVIEVGEHAEAGEADLIDRLPADHKDLLQTLAVIGTEFKLGLVRKVEVTQPSNPSVSAIWVYRSVQSRRVPILLATSTSWRWIYSQMISRSSSM